MHRTSLLVCFLTWVIIGYGQPADSAAIATTLLESTKVIRSEPLKTLQLAKEAIALAKQLGNKSLEAEGLKVIGNVHYLLADYSEASRFFHEALQIFISLSDTLSQAGMLGNIGLVYKETGENEKALAAYDQGLKLVSDSDEKNIRAMLLNNKGVIYRRMKKFDQAIGHFTASMELKRKRGDKRGISSSLTNLGNVASEQREYLKAIRYYHQSLDLEEELKNDEGMAMNYNNLGAAHLASGRIDSALYYASRGFAIADRLGTKIQLVESARTLATIYEGRGDFANAFRYFKVYATAQDSISNEDEARKLGRLESKLDLEKKEREIEALNQQSKLTEQILQRRKLERNSFMAIAAVVLLAGVIIVLIQRQKSTLQMRLLNEEIYNLRSEIRQLTGKYEGKLELSLEELNKKLVNPLSEREYDVLIQVFSQKSNQEIADELFVSINTVKTHLKNLYSKLGVPNRRAALDLLSKT